MFAFLMTLLVWRSERKAPCGAGGHPEEKPPDLEAENRRNHATAYYWDVYGALDTAHNASLEGRGTPRPEQSAERSPRHSRSDC